MGLFSRLSGECICPPWLTLHSKGEAGYFDPLDTPGFLGGLFGFVAAGGRFVQKSIRKRMQGD